MIEKYGDEIKLTKKEHKRFNQNKKAMPVIIDDLEEAVVAAPEAKSKSANKWE